MVAFVGSSMANTAEVKVIKMELEGQTCIERAITFMDYLDPNNEMDPVEAYDYYRGFIDACNATSTTPKSKQIEGLNQ